jgi:hypothetical protein
LLASTELHELWRLPILVQHFIEHNTAGLSTSVVDFITLHYGYSEPHDERDMELPFKQHDSCLTSVVMAILPTFQIAQPASIAVSHSYQFLELNLPLNFYRADIWQPPRA